MNTNGFNNVGDSRVALSGRALDLCRWLDKQFVAMADADESQFPSEIARSTLDRAGYFEAYPDGAISVSETYVLMPAVCYHCYAQWTGERLREPRTVTCAGKCGRNESEPPARWREFTMREIVFIGERKWVAQRRWSMMKRVQRFAKSLGLFPWLELASDPFFGSVGRGKQLLQQLKRLKYELRIDLPLWSGRPIAIASFNLHETHFTKRFDIALADGKAAYTGCVAFGLERWTLAALEAGYDLR